MPQTSTIVIENNDSRMWHLDQVIIDIMVAVSQDHDIVIHLNFEGPCAASLGLYKLLDKVCASTNYTPDRFQIVTCNLLEQHASYQVKIVAPIKHIVDLQQQLTAQPAPYKQITKHTKQFGHFIGHSSRVRLAIGSYLYVNYKDQTLLTYHCVPTNEYHREFIGLEDMLFHRYDYQHFVNACELLTYTPLTFDTVQTYPIANQKMYGINDAYQDIFVDIVCQTYYNGRTFYMDEKLWRPIITKTPFMVHGSQNFIKNFRRLGFKTFDQWWDEGYSEDPPDYQVDQILRNIDQLSKLDDVKLNNMYNEMKPILDYNYNLFLSLTPDSFFKDYQ
jgi:hypothetical protein